MQLSISKKLFLGFGGVIAAIVISAIFTYFQTKSMRESQDTVLNVRYPTLLAGNQLISGMDKSLAALRGYMILGGEAQAGAKFQEQRLAAWQSIDEAIAFFDGIQNEANDDQIAIINQIKTLLASIRKNQHEIEQIAQTPGNQPALELLLTEAGPKADQMLTYLGQMIELESEVAEQDRGEMFKLLADSRGAFAISVGSLRAFLITGESFYKDRFDENWLINTDAYIAIDEEIDMLSEAQLELWKKYEALREQFAPVSIRMFELRLSERWNIANHKLENDVEPDILKISALLERMKEGQKAKLSEDVNQLDEILAQLDMVTILATLFSILASIAIGRVIGTKVARAMEALVKDAHDIAEGNLATDHSNDELRSSSDETGLLARKFFDMSHSLSDMISTVKSHGVQMRIAAFQVASLSEEILSTTEQEQNNSGEVSDATNRLLEASQRSLALATESSKLVESAQKQADIGIEAVNETLAAMEQSVKEVQETVTGIQGLDEASQRIFSITDTIHQIAEQTNLLALNAAIEAARAGEHGRGFAVVADEVRNLASKTSQATVEITDLIGVLKNRVDESIESMTRAANHVYASQEKTAVTSNAINSICESVELISQSSKDICTGADSQMAQLGMLQDKLNQLFETLKEDSSRAGAVSIVARVLYSVTENINSSLDRFITLPNGQYSAKKQDDRRLMERIYGCLRVEIYQECGAYEGVTRSFSGDHLGIEVSTKLQENAPVALTIFLPHRSFEDYKSQIPITIEGKIIRCDFVESVYHYSVQISANEGENIDKLQQSFEFFSHGIEMQPPANREENKLLPAA